MKVEEGEMTKEKEAKLMKEGVSGVIVGNKLIDFYSGQEIEIEEIDENNVGNLGETRPQILAEA